MMFALLKLGDSDHTRDAMILVATVRLTPTTIHKLHRQTTK